MESTFEQLIWVGQGQKQVEAQPSDSFYYNNTV